MPLGQIQGIFSKTFTSTISLSNLFYFRTFSPSKLDPEGPAYAKMIKSKKFDPAKSAVLEVMSEQEKGIFAVDTAAVRQAREEGHDGGRRI